MHEQTDCALIKAIDALVAHRGGVRPSGSPPLGKDLPTADTTVVLCAHRPGARLRKYHARRVLVILRVGHGDVHATLEAAGAAIG